MDNYLITLAVLIFNSLCCLHIDLDFTSIVNTKIYLYNAHFTLFLSLTQYTVYTFVQSLYP